MCQINGVIDTETKGIFLEYSAGIGVDASTLLRILISRELHRKKLEALSVEINLRALVKIKRCRKKVDKVTAHFAAKSQIQASTAAQFSKYSDSIGLRKTETATLLIYDEVETRWLERSLCVDD